ncbi:MAG: response regulator [Chloroflexi bacterium]|nr:response regulator [Chloroflexota bacterium]
MTSYLPSDISQETSTPTIMVVDDEPPARRLLSMNLRVRGFGVVCAENGAQALELVNTQHVDLILLDIMLPDIDGFEVCRRVCRNSPVPIIMVSARGLYNDRATSLNAGAIDFFPKPVQMQLLIKRIREALD